MKKHGHCGTANTPEAFRTFIGCTVKGFLTNALPVGRADLARGTKTLIFECGYGLTIASNGSYWTESPDEIKRALGRAESELAKTKTDLEHVISLSGTV